MPATARQIPIDSEDFSGGQGGSYAEIPTPSEQKLRLSDVKDYDKRAEGKTYGWVFVYEVDVPSGGSVPFNIYLSFSKAARWKLIQVLQAHDVELEDAIDLGHLDVDPNLLIGDVIGGIIDFPRDKQGEPTSQYREVQDVFSLTNTTPAEELQAELPQAI